MVGRERERREVQRALDSAQSGVSATLALVGEPGIGKTALLEHAAERAGGMRLLRARGIESEAEIPFASLLELLRPALLALERIPEPQATALASALALRPGGGHDRFAVGAGTLSLLAAYTEHAPVIVLIDDAQWLDVPSGQALLFAFRRLIADPIAVFVAVREGEPSFLDGADLSVLRIGGLSPEEAGQLLPGISPRSAARLYAQTAGNPLGLLELAPDAEEVTRAPAGAPLLVSSRISRAFARRVATLERAAQDALVLAATSDSGDLLTLELAADHLDLDLRALMAAEAAGLITLQAGQLEFRHPLVRSAIYAAASPAHRRAAHRALAAALPDRDVDRRAWHLAAAAIGTDPSAAAALEQAGRRARERTAYATAAAAFERAAQLSPDTHRETRLLLDAAEASWHAGLAERASELLERARSSADGRGPLVEIDQLAGHIAARRGPVMAAHAILTAAARRADPEHAVAMLAEAAVACFLAGEPAAMLSAAQQAKATLPANASTQSRFLAATALGMAQIFGGDAAAGATELREAVALAEQTAELRENLQLLPWLVQAPIFLREADAGRGLLDEALAGARARAAVSALPFVLNLIARDQATSDRWTIAETSYGEAIELARESAQQTEIGFALAGLASLHARRGRESECRKCATEGLDLSRQLGTRLHEIWIAAALGELELGLGRPAQAAEHFERQQGLLTEAGITDVDLRPAPELVDAYSRLGRLDEARRVATAFRAAAEAKSQPWPVARALRAAALVAGDDSFADLFEAALTHHAQTPDAFEAGRTRLAYGERLRRARNRTLARAQLRAALDIFDQLGARPWAEQARAELAASGETLRRRDPSSIDELTPQELQIALRLAAGNTTRETAAALFLSPKTVEYHLRHVYMKLGTHTREELKDALHNATTLRPNPPGSDGATCS